MSVLIPDRVLQTTTTSGAGAYSLIDAIGAYRAFNVAYATGAHVPYCCTDNQFGFEVGIGTLTIGSPDTISRASILLSSNSNSAVNWLGTTKQIFAWDVSGSAYVGTFSGTLSVSVQDWGTAFVFVGGSTGTVNLPSLSMIPRGYSFRIKNSGSATCNVTPNGTDQIETFGASTAYAQSPGSSATYASDLTVWRRVDVSSSPDSVATGIAAAGSNQSGATPLTAMQNYVSTSIDGTKGVRVAASLMIPGTHIYVANEDASNTLACYPDTGVAINAQSANAAVTGGILANSTAHFVVKSTSALRTVP